MNSVYIPSVSYRRPHLQPQSIQNKLHQVLSPVHGDRDLGGVRIDLASKDIASFGKRQAFFVLLGHRLHPMVG